MHPIERMIRANGLEHHVLTWNDRGDETVVLCHGFLDMAWSFAGLGESLSQLGYRVMAFDWRGHGETEWVGNGGYYHFPDYVLDLDSLLPQLSTPKVHLVGHSMGGTACALLAATRPSFLNTLTLIEGLGPPTDQPQNAPKRMQAFLDTVARTRNQETQPMRSVDEALTRMRVLNPQLDDQSGRFLARKATRPINEQGWRVWRFDPLHRTTSPTPYLAEIFGTFLTRIEAPTLVIAGQKGFRVPDEKERMRSIANHRFIELQGVGHMVHWFAPQETANRLHGFFPSARS